MRINPINSLYNDMIKILQSSVIKYNFKAEEYESLDMRKQVDKYFDALYERDTFDTYSDYSEQEMRDAGMISESDIVNGLNDSSTIPKMYQSTLLANRRKYIISNYVEKNNYYRMLNGLPDLEDKDFIYLDDDTANAYGIDKSIPIHLIEDQLGSHYMDTLESIGYIDKLIETYPKKNYLKFLGTTRISIADARQAKNFSLLYINPNITESVLTKFVLLYDQCREYFVNTIYIFEYRNVFDYYDNFIAMSIMVMALQQLISRSMEMSIKREFFDDYAVQLLYSTYNMPYNSRIDSTTQKAIVQNLNLLIQNKASNNVIYDIASLLGYDRIKIYCYYLMKERKFDSFGRPIVEKTTKRNEETNELEEVYDYERMYDVYFQKVELNDYDYHQALEDPANRVSYDSVTSEDPFWWEDDELYKEVWESEYNFKESKYLGITISYKLTEIMYENIILLKMIMDKKEELNGIMVDLPKIVESGKLNLFDSVILLCALICKKYSLSGEIVSQPSQTLHVLDTLDRMYNPESSYDSLCFNFEKLLPENFDETTKDIFKVMDDDDRENFLRYVSILSVSGSTLEDRIHALNDMYQNIKGLSKFLSAKISAATDIEEYRIYTKFYRTLFYTKETNKMFSIKGETETPKTFIEYIQKKYPAIYDFIETIDTESMYMYINHVIAGIEDVVSNLNYLYIINDSSSSLQEILIELIKFFKSYTTDMIGLNIVYIFDFKPDNMMKLLDRVEMIQKDLLVPDTINLSYADYLRLHGLIRLKNEWILHDNYFVHAIWSLFDPLRFEDLIHHLQKKIGMGDDLLLNDKYSISAKEMVDDLLKFRDQVLRVYKTLGPKESITFNEKINYMKKLNNFDDSLNYYDSVSKMISSIRTKDPLKLSDTCTVIRNE